MDLGAPQTTIVADIGNLVLCDICNKDYTESDVSGGIIFQSKGICPDCSPGVLQRAKEFGELDFVRDGCPPDMSFRDFCLRARGGDNTIRITTYDK